MPNSIQGKGSQKRFAKPLVEGKTYIATSPKLADCDPYFIFELPKRYCEHIFAALFPTKARDLGLNRISFSLRPAGLSAAEEISVSEPERDLALSVRPIP